jgi:DNA-binding transcriptional ArsR family regulator
MESKTAVKALAALAQDSRLAIFRALVVAGPEGLTVGKISEEVGVAPATLSFHLKELVNADLISSRQESRFIYYSANYSEMNELLGFLTKNCCSGKSCEPLNSSSKKKTSNKGAKS